VLFLHQKRQYRSYNGGSDDWNENNYFISDIICGIQLATGEDPRLQLDFSDNKLSFLLIQRGVGNRKKHFIGNLDGLTAKKPTQFMNVNFDENNGNILITCSQNPPKLSFSFTLTRNVSVIY